MDSRLTELPRDVLGMLQAELGLAKRGYWKLHPNADGVDMDLVEMLEEAIAEIKRLRALATSAR